MEMGMIGLGRMGANMARRLRKGGVEVVAWNRDAKVTRDLAKETGLKAAASLEALISQLKSPRIVWLMLPAGEVTQQHIDKLSTLLSPGDIVVDGANSYYKDSMRRGQALAAKKLQFIDAGVSGGVWGLEKSMTRNPCANQATGISVPVIFSHGWWQPVNVGRAEPSSAST